MKADFSWKQTIGKYLDVYKAAEHFSAGQTSKNVKPADV
jgi:glycogen synthase